MTVPQAPYVHPQQPYGQVMPAGAPVGAMAYAGQAWAPVATVSDKSYVVAVLLSFFLGGLGVDRFYLGYVGLGLAKFFLGWLTLGIWPLVDFILIAMRKVPDAQGRPLA